MIDGVQCFGKVYADDVESLTAFVRFPDNGLLCGQLAGCLYVKALHLLQGTGLIAVVDINRTAYIAERLPIIDSTCSIEPKSTPCLQRARVIEVWLIVSKP
ncbi:conserved hypothetical protein [Trichinella spiralis]|uniref:hypothetical protein n=1 Tax=Trichinella spiralis TaxID=6334 RepID=UPI0001EFB536|nr:conserved hypothetical protein [Trichinella spiralis]